MAAPSADRDAVEQAVIRGSELLKQGKLDDAQKAFRSALLLEGENPRVLALLGLAHFRANQFEPARAIYEDLVERAPTDASHRLNLGLVYLKLGDSDKAISTLEASRALDPSQGRAVSYLGLAYARAGRYAEAYRSFLLAGQNELATEIESNLTQAERDGIHSQLQRTGIERAKTPSTPPAVARTASKEIPVVARTRSQDVHAPAPSVARTRSQEVHAPAPVAPQSMPAPRVTESIGGMQSMPAIVVDRPPVPDPEPAAPSLDPDARMTDSVQFVLPTRVAPTPLPGQSMISRAVEVTSPATAAAPGRVAQGSTPPVPLSQLATSDLVRPEDGDEPFEVSASGALVIRVRERTLTRLDGVHVTGGDLSYEPAMRRSRGHQTEDKFDYGGTQLHSVSGEGYLIAVPGKRIFTAVVLDDDICYLREDLVFAFEATLRWENGNVPGLRGRLPVVQFRGDGALVIRSEKPLVPVKLPANGVVFVDATRIAGWIGRVIPRAVVPPVGGPMGEVCIECTGEGIILVDPVGDPGLHLVTRVEAKASPPPPPPAAPVELDLVKNAEWLLDENGEDKPAAAPAPPDDDAGRDEF